MGRPGALGALCITLSACATTPAGMRAIKRIDRNQFEITSHVIGSPSGSAAVKADGDRIATQFCLEKSQPMTVVERHGYGGVAAQDILVFRCGESAAAKKGGAAITSSPPVTAAR